MNRTDEQIDLIVWARDIMLQRAAYYTERQKVTRDEIAAARSYGRINMI